MKTHLVKAETTAVSVDKAFWYKLNISFSFSGILLQYVPNQEWNNNRYCKMDPMFTSKIYFHDGGNGMYAADHCQISPIFPFGKFYWVTKHYAGIMMKKLRYTPVNPNFPYIR